MLRPCIFFVTAELQRYCEAERLHLPPSIKASSGMVGTVDFVILSERRITARLSCWVEDEQYSCELTNVRRQCGRASPFFTGRVVRQLLPCELIFAPNRRD